MQAQHLYVHVPFCARRCVYCDFSIAVRPRVPVDEYVGAVDRELSLRHCDSTFHLESLYLGGGTPSKLGGDGVAQLMVVVRRHVALRADAEITLEANPEDVSPDAASSWRQAGVNRVSLGVQSFDDAVLAWMHRTHDAKQALAAVQVLREIGIPNISLDLIFAVPAHLGRSWERDVEMTLRLELPHISVYGLTVEPHTPLGRWVARRDVTEAPDESFEQQFLSAHERLSAVGFDHYEVSNYGRPESHSRHNWAYWKRKPYGGIGPSAHEFDGTVRRWNAASYTDWLRRLASDHDPVAGSEELEVEQAMSERTYLGLRTSTGIEVTPDERERVSPWVAAGWAVQKTEERLRLTPVGWLRLDALATDLTQRRSRY